ncbi:MAG: PHB depolymerase family esterase [Pseudomonadota bacterium]
MPATSNPALGIIGALVATIAAALPLSVGACGTSDALCAIEGGTYRAALPEASEAAPFVVFLHGYGASSGTPMGRETLLVPFLARGIAVIAPEGLRWNGDGGRDWGVNDGHDWPRDDKAFIAAVAQDAAERFGLDPSQMLIAGYSRGGSMAWDFACARPDLAHALAAQSGAFWEPMADTCEAPVPVFHSHGMADRMVPFEGRSLTWDGESFTQGNVMKAIDVWREVNGCRGPSQFEDEVGHWTKRWECSKAPITLSLGPWGHNRQPDWADRTAAWFASLIAAE